MEAILSKNDASNKIPMPVSIIRWGTEGRLPEEERLGTEAGQLGLAREMLKKEMFRSGTQKRTGRCVCLHSCSHLHVHVCKDRCTLSCVYACHALCEHSVFVHPWIQVCAHV